MTHAGGCFVPSIYFDLVVSAPAIEKSKQNGFVKGVFGENLRYGVNMLQYTNDPNIYYKMI